MEQFCFEILSWLPVLAVRYHCKNPLAKVDGKEILMIWEIVAMATLCSAMQGCRTHNQANKHTRNHDTQQSVAWMKWTIWKHQLSSLLNWADTFCVTVYFNYWLKTFKMLISLRHLFRVLHSKTATFSTVYQSEDYVNGDIYTRLANC